MLSQIVILVFLSILNTTYSQDCLRQDLIPQEDAYDKKLHIEKMKNYRVSQPPRNQSCVTVKVRFQLKSFAFDEYEDKFTARMWTRMVWSDERLTWSPKDYGGVARLVVRPTDIWTPSLVLLNSVVRSVDPDLFIVEVGECIVFSHGGVMCVPEIIYESLCSAKLRNWPFDVQNCTLQFGSGDRFGVTRFRLENKNDVSIFPADYGVGWFIGLTDSKEDPDARVKLSITLTLERQASGVVIILVGPCIVLSILTTTSILLNVNDYVRLGFSCFSLLSHFAFLFFVDEFLPKHSADTPVILFLIRDSVIVTITSLLVTFVLSKIVRRKTVPFEWVSLVSNKLLGSFGQYLIIPKWETNSDSEDIKVKNKEIWTNFANILNSFYLVIVVIVYIILFSAYTPKQPPVK